MDFASWLRSLRDERHLLLAGESFPVLRIAAAVIVVAVVKAAVDTIQARRSCGPPSIPSRYFLFGTSSIVPNAILPLIEGVAIGMNSEMDEKWSTFERSGTEIQPLFGILTGDAVAFRVADVEVIKYMFSSKTIFRKPIELYSMVSLYGTNIVASEGDEWKRFRQVCGPSFSERTNRLVWDETYRIMDDLFRDVFGEKDEIVYDNVLDLTLSIALFVIGSAGFGQRLSWHNEAVPAPGFKNNFKQALSLVIINMVWKIVLPSWAFRLSKGLKEKGEAFEELEGYMRLMIKERREELLKTGKMNENDEVYEEVESTLRDAHVGHDLLTNLIKYNLREGDGPAALTDAELIGNIFIFLLAGHDTSSNTMAFTLGMLALYPEEQEEVYQEIKSVLPSDRQPVYSDLARLKYCAAVYNETLRMFPPVPTIPKRCFEDTVVMTRNPQGEKVPLLIPKGAKIDILAGAVHYNPKYWPDPEEFRPERFMVEDWPRDAFIPFSGGSRVCLGRKFFEAEVTATLALILSKYSVHIKEEPQYANETWAERRARVMKTKRGINLMPERIPLVFRRRK